MSQTSPHQPARSVLPILFAILFGAITLYGSLYVYARVTHKLVRYSYAFIGRPGAMSGFGFVLDPWELCFLPLSTLEMFVRKLLL